MTMHELREAGNRYNNNEPDEGNDGVGD